jgi:hypothetical protein
MGYELLPSFDIMEMVGQRVISRRQDLARKYHEDRYQAHRHTLTHMDPRDMIYQKIINRILVQITRINTMLRQCPYS